MLFETTEAKLLGKEPSVEYDTSIAYYTRIGGIHTDLDGNITIANLSFRYNNQEYYIRLDKNLKMLTVSTIRYDSLYMVQEGYRERILEALAEMTKDYGDIVKELITIIFDFNRKGYIYE